MSEWLAERGILVDQSTVYRWVQRFLPLFGNVARQYRKSVGPDCVVWAELLAAMPEPITAIKSMAVPMNSAAALRASDSTSRPTQRQQSP